ncbi:SMP-30/gluconolactonase/LRE family protein [Amycolatopsis thermoflava]|uniref:SMP-30/gluconolactonase/LRE family protein n=1 Tax=Amycolatopsis thermoflava TaxID=84480 RepID=UPI003EC14473
MTEQVRAEAVGRQRAKLGESPFWCPDEGLFWIDVEGHRLLLHTGTDDGVTVQLSQTVTAVAPTGVDALLAVTPSGIARLHISTGLVEDVALADLPAEQRMNDGAVDHSGRYWVGARTSGKHLDAGLYRFDGAELVRREGGLGLSNGMDWSPDGLVMYHADSRTGVIYAREYDPDCGTFGRSRPLRCFTRAEGVPDGLCVDAAGSLWVALWGAGCVQRLSTEDGSTNLVVMVPTPFVSSCTFGDSDLSTLYVTTAERSGDPLSGYLFRARVSALGTSARLYTGCLRP